MCIIIYGKKKIEEEFLQDSYRINKDGIGLMWSENDKLKTMVTLDYSTFLTEYNSLTERGIFPAIHFRAATIGGVCLDNCHPFLVNESIGLMHNGTMKLGLPAATNYYGTNFNYDFYSSYTTTSKNSKVKTKTDSEHFAELISDMTWQEYDILDKKIFDVILNGSRVLLMNNKGEVKILNRNSSIAIEEDGVWYSKNNVHKNINVFVYGSLKKGYGNHENHLGDQKFVKEVKIEGFDMYSVGAFPAIVDGTTTIHGEMYKVSGEAFKALDRLEGYPNHYNRKLVKSTTGEEAWIYFYKKPPFNQKKIESGFWEKPVYSYMPLGKYFTTEKKAKSLSTYEKDVEFAVKYDPVYKELKTEKEKKDYFNLCVELAMLEDDSRFNIAEIDCFNKTSATYYGSYSKNNIWVSSTKKQRVEYLREYYGASKTPKLTEIAKKKRNLTLNEDFDAWEEAEKRCKHLTGNEYTAQLFEEYDKIQEDILARESKVKESKNEFQDNWDSAEQLVLSEWIQKGKAIDKRDAENQKDYWEEVSELAMGFDSNEQVPKVENIDLNIDILELDMNDPFYFSE